jgi:hypothetical protein
VRLNRTAMAGDDAALLRARTPARSVLDVTRDPRVWARIRAAAEDVLDRGEAAFHRLPPDTPLPALVRAGLLTLDQQEVLDYGSMKRHACAALSWTASPTI